MAISEDEACRRLLAALEEADERYRRARRIRRIFYLIGQLDIPAINHVAEKLDQILGQ